MNSFLISALRILNGLIALIIIVISTVLGASIASSLRQPLVPSTPVSNEFVRLFSSLGTVAGGLVGALSGLVLAAMSCGPMAVLIEIPNKLGQIRDAIERHTDISSQERSAHPTPPTRSSSHDDTRWRPR